MFITDLLGSHTKHHKFQSVLFVTRYGNPYITTAVGNEFKKLLRATDNYVKGVTFYSLRRTFRTIADETGDFAAIDLIMGHKSNSMAALYRQRIRDKRLLDVAKYVRRWLFGRRIAK